MSRRTSRRASRLLEGGTSGRRSGGRSGREAGRGVVGQRESIAQTCGDEVRCGDGRPPRGGARRRHRSGGVRRVLGADRMIMPSERGSRERRRSGGAQTGATPTPRPIAESVLAGRQAPLLSPRAVRRPRILAHSRHEPSIRAGPPQRRSSAPGSSYSRIRRRKSASPVHASAAATTTVPGIALHSSRYFVISPVSSIPRDARTSATASMWPSR